MRQFALTCLSAAVGCILTGPASAGVKVSSVEQTYQIQVLFAVPPADAPEGARIQVVGYAQSLLDAREVQE